MQLMPYKQLYKVIGYRNGRASAGKTFIKSGDIIGVMFRALKIMKQCQDELIRLNGK